MFISPREKREKAQDKFVMRLLKDTGFKKEDAQKILKSARQMANAMNKKV